MSTSKAKKTWEQLQEEGSTEEESQVIMEEGSTEEESQVIQEEGSTEEESQVIQKVSISHNWKKTKHF